MSSKAGRIAAVAVIATLAVNTCASTSATATSSSRQIHGTVHDDTLHGTPGNDTIQALAGDDLLIGGRGDDVLLGGPGSDITRGGPGNDRIVDGWAGDSPNWVRSGRGNDLINLVGLEHVHAGIGDDDITLEDAAPGTTVDCGPGQDAVTFSSLAPEHPTAVPPDVSVMNCEHAYFPQPN